MGPDKVKRDEKLIMYDEKNDQKHNDKKKWREVLIDENVKTIIVDVQQNETTIDLKRILKKGKCIERILVIKPNSIFLNCKN